MRGNENSAGRVLFFFGGGLVACLVEAEMRAGDLPERAKDEDRIKDTLNQEDEILTHAEISTTSATRIIQQECRNNDYGYPPTCEVPPCLKYFITHFVGDEGEEKEREKWH